MVKTFVGVIDFGFRMIVLMMAVLFGKLFFQVPHSVE